MLKIQLPNEHRQRKPIHLLIHPHKNNQNFWNYVYCDEQSAYICGMRVSWVACLLHWKAWLVALKENGIFLNLCHCIYIWPWDNRIVSVSILMDHNKTLLSLQIYKLRSKLCSILNRFCCCFSLYITFGCTDLIMICPPPIKCLLEETNICMIQTILMLRIHLFLLE